MVFAEAARPAPAMWKAWDSLGLTHDGVKLVGWWEDDVPITTSHSDVYASVYIRPGNGAVVALASWHGQGSLEVELAINWQALGLEQEHASIIAHSIDGFQPAATFSP